MVLALLTVVAVVIAVRAQGPSSGEGSEVQRYQLQQINEYGPKAAAAPTTVILDTKTGQLWKLVTQRCPDDTHREGWEKLPGLGKNEYGSMTFSCAPPPAR